MVRTGRRRPQGSRHKAFPEDRRRREPERHNPLEVMLKAMREYYEKKEWDAASAIAKDATPYMHAKLASVQHTGRNGGPIQRVDLAT